MSNHLNELSFFSGAGCGLCGTKLLGWKNIGYVEWDGECQKILAKRIEEGYLDEAPIFSDIKAFLSEGYAKSYKGLVDVITAGLPCQPYSIAGKQLGKDDPRNLWPETRDCIGVIRPKYALLENSPALISNSYFPEILGDISEMGYNATWGVIGGAQAGFYTRRERVWVLCWNGESGLRGYNQNGDIERVIAKLKLRRANKLNRIQDLKSHWEMAIDKPFGVDNGAALGLDRVRAIGNGQIPAVVELAWHTLISQI